MRALEGAQALALVGDELIFHLAPEPHPRDRFAPECAASFFEPIVVRRKCPRPLLEAGTQLGHARGAFWRPTKLHDPPDRLEDSHPARGGVPFWSGARMENRVFFPQGALDQWLVDETVDLTEGELTILGAGLGVGRRYKVVDAVRIVREVSGTGDAQGLVGRAKARGHLEQLGAELVETSMLVGDAAYDVEPGWLGLPIGSFAEYVASDARMTALGKRSGDDPKSDEDLLGRFLAKDP
jgi:hypothetical protein